MKLGKLDQVKALQYCSLTIMNACIHDFGGIPSMYFIY